MQVKEQTNNPPPKPNNNRKKTKTQTPVLVLTGMELIIVIAACMVLRGLC